jgi:glycosyltransferase involved in cell wall biosynthesis
MDASSFDGDSALHPESSNALGSQPLASVIVCAYSNERLQLLLETIASLEKQTYAHREIVIVVDYNPELQHKLGHLAREGVRIAHNTGQQGLADARNSGIALAQGEIIAFIDDDAAGDSRWLEELVACYRDPDVVASGGRILPVWEGGKRPAWLPEEFLWIIGCTYRGMQTSGAIRNMIGCNMSFRSEVFEEVGGFNTSVGRLGSQPLGCEETEICIRTLARWPEKRIAYAAGAIVHHHVSRPRQTIRYFTRRCYFEGVSKLVVRRLCGAAGTSSEISYLSRTLPRAILGDAWNVISVKDVWASASRIAMIAAGIGAVGAGFVAGMLTQRNDRQ